MLAGIVDGSDTMGWVWLLLCAIVAGIYFGHPLAFVAMFSLFLGVLLVLFLKALGAREMSCDEWHN